MELDNGRCEMPRPAPSLGDEAPRRSYKKRCASGVFVADITRDMLRSLMHLPSHQAARSLGVGITVFKKLCRQRGIQQWPYVKPSFRTEAKGAGKADGWRRGPRSSSSSGGGSEARACRREQLSEASAASSDVVPGPPRQGPLHVAPVRPVPGEPGAACRLQRLLEVLKGSSTQGQLSPHSPGKLYESWSSESARTCMGGAALRQCPPSETDAAHAQAHRQAFQPAARDTLAPRHVAADTLEEACLARAPALAEPLSCIAKELAKDPGLLLAALQRSSAVHVTSDSPGSAVADGRPATANGSAAGAAAAAVAAVLRQATRMASMQPCKVPASPFLHSANSPLPAAAPAPHRLVPPAPAAGSLELPAVQSAMLGVATGSPQLGPLQHAAVSQPEEPRVHAESLRGHRRPPFHSWSAAPARVSPGHCPHAAQEPLATTVLALAAAAAAAEEAGQGLPLRQPRRPQPAVAPAAAEAAVVPRRSGKEQKNRVVLACLVEEQRHYVRMQQLQALLGRQPPASVPGKPGREP
ncbi:hypothetical protein N2152v2_002004 [Parachlorella kessleri]